MQKLTQPDPSVTYHLIMITKECVIYDVPLIQWSTWTTMVRYNIYLFSSENIALYTNINSHKIINQFREISHHQGHEESIKQENLKHILNLI